MRCRIMNDSDATYCSAVEDLGRLPRAKMALDSLDESLPTMKSIRDACPTARTDQLDGRVGRDGRVRPLNSGGRRAIAHRRQPAGPLRFITKQAGLPRDGPRHQGSDDPAATSQEIEQYPGRPRIRSVPRPRTLTKATSEGKAIGDFAF